MSADNFLHHACPLFLHFRMVCLGSPQRLHSGSDCRGYYGNFSSGNGEGEQRPWRVSQQQCHGTACPHLPGRLTNRNSRTRGEESDSEVFDVSISPEPGSYFMVSAKVFLSPPATVSLVGEYDGIHDILVGAPCFYLTPSVSILRVCMCVGTLGLCTLLDQFWVHLDTDTKVVSSDVVTEDDSLWHCLHEKASPWILLTPLLWDYTLCECMLPPKRHPWMFLSESLSLKSRASGLWCTLPCVTSFWVC